MQLRGTESITCSAVCVTRAVMPQLSLGAEFRDPGSEPTGRRAPDRKCVMGLLLEYLSLARNVPDTKLCLLFLLISDILIHKNMCNV